MPARKFQPDASQSDESSTAIVAVPETAAEDQLMSIAAAARVVGVGESTIRRGIAAGLVQAVKDAGGALRLTQTQVYELRAGATKRTTLGNRQGPATRGEIAARAYPLFDDLLAGKKRVEDIVVELQVDPSIVHGLLEDWHKSRALTQKLLPGPKFDHSPSKDWDCCDGHRAAKASQRK